MKRMFHPMFCMLLFTMFSCTAAAAAAAAAACSMFLRSPQIRIEMKKYFLQYLDT
jgi:hypothetical protein